MRSRRALLCRKLVHAALTSLLLLPFVIDVRQYGLSPLSYYVISFVIALMIYIVSLRRLYVVRLLVDGMHCVRSYLMMRIEKIGLSAAPLLTALIALDKLILRTAEFIDGLRKDYERDYGFISIVAGAASVLLAYLLTGLYVFYGVLALLVYDSLSSIFGSLLGRTCLPRSRATLEGSLLASATFFAALMLMGAPIVHSLVVSICTAILEAYSVEDNLVIPVSVSAIALALHLPIPVCT